MLPTSAHTLYPHQVGMKQVDNFYNVTSLSWKPDGSKLCVGSMTGTVDMYDACVKRHKYKVRGGREGGRTGNQERSNPWNGAGLQAGRGIGEGDLLSRFCPDVSSSRQV